MRETTNDLTKMHLTFYIAVIGIGALLVVFLVTVFVFREGENPAETIVAVLGAVTGVIGTLAGYVAGQTAGAAGREGAEQRADNAQDKLQAVLDVTGPDTLGEARSRYPELFT